jgi:hypothetical protein
MARTKQTKRTSTGGRAGKTLTKQRDVLPVAMAGRYWQETGRFEKEQKFLSEKLGNLVGDARGGKFDWTSEKNAIWALFNGMLGLYYGFYNDGDKAAGAIDNNRVHGYRSVGAYEALAQSMGATAVVKYLHYGSEENLERAMDEAICLAWDHEHAPETKE